jgi:hypothetical protein
MNLMDLFRRRQDVSPVVNREAVLARYRRLRAVGRDLNNRLVARLSKDALHEGGRRLGILRGGALVFETEDQAAVLMDYCLYDVRRKGRTTIEQYLIDSQPEPEADEMACLRSMQHAIYSLFVVKSVERGLGVIVRDLMSQEVFLVVDLGLGSSADPGLVFASRLLHHDGFSMTGGAALPVGVLPADQQAALVTNVSLATTPDADGCCDPAPLIRACLSGGCSAHIEYQEPWGQTIGQQQIANGNSSSAVGRNSPCPCGSGKKFKQCCLKYRRWGRKHSPRCFSGLQQNVWARVRVPPRNLGFYPQILLKTPFKRRRAADPKSPVSGQKTGRHAHEPLSSSKMPANVLAEVPLTGLPFIRRRHRLRRPFAHQHGRHRSGAHGGLRPDRT